MSGNGQPPGDLNIENYLTIDVEDYYQVSAFENIVGYGKWDKHNSRVVANTRNVLDILERKGVKATFFVLGWVAEKFPRLIKDIQLKGHEIGCHSYCHRLIYDLSPEEFRDDTKRAKDIIEQVTGTIVKGYRAPSYSITKKSLWAVDILQDLGFIYDSSIFPVPHDRYGIPDAPRFRYQLPGSTIVEYPLSTFLLNGLKIPVAGGGYFRLFPYFLTKLLLEKINVKEQQPFVFYMHPWEIDPEQPRMKGAGMLSKFRHYNNLDKMAGRFEMLLDNFSFGPIPGN